MNKITFQGESAGSVAYLNRTSSRGGESAGSIGKVSENQEEVTLVQSPQSDTLSFKGKEDKNNSSCILSAVAGAAIVASATIGGLAYAHKSGSIAKLKDGNVKKHLSKAAETCYGWCKNIKNSSEKYYNKVKDFFTKKS